jgi:hypothetical protein
MLLAQQVRDIARRHPALTHWRSRAGLALIADRGDPIALDQHPGGAGVQAVPTRAIPPVNSRRRTLASPPPRMPNLLLLPTSGKSRLDGYAPGASSWSPSRRDSAGCTPCRAGCRLWATARSRCKELRTLRSVQHERCQRWPSYADARRLAFVSVACRSLLAARQFGVDVTWHLAARSRSHRRECNGFPLPPVRARTDRGGIVAAL